MMLILRSGVTPFQCNLRKSGYRNPSKYDGHVIELGVVLAGDWVAVLKGACNVELDKLFFPCRISK